MDAPTIVSLSAAVGYAVPEALVEEMRLGELERMRRHDLESYMAQRHYVSDLLAEPNALLVTWRTAFTRAWNAAWDLGHAMRRALVFLRLGSIGPAEQVLQAALDEDSDDEAGLGVP